MRRKRVTITLDDDVACWTRRWVARHDTTLSRLVGRLLRGRMVEEEGYARAMKEYLSRKPAVLSRSPPPPRSALHQRDAGKPVLRPPG